MDNIDVIIKENLNEFLDKNAIKIWHRFKKNGIGNSSGDRTSYRSYVKKKRKIAKGNGKSINNSIYFQPIRVVHNEWLVHYTSLSRAKEIIKNGFKGMGISATPYGTGDNKKSSKNGYNYAFLAKDVFGDDEEGRDVYNFFMNSGLIFKANGVLGYHYGDKNRQVIFYGKSAHDFYFFDENGLYDITGKLLLSSQEKRENNANEHGKDYNIKYDKHNYLANNLEDRINWLIKTQYK